MSKKSICEECGSRIRFAEGVRLEGPGRAVRLLCNKCFNQFKAKAMDLDFEHPAFSPVTMEDCEGVRHRFEIRTMLMGELVTLRAVEELGNGAVGYEIEVLGNPEDDPMELFQRLYERLHRELGRKHLVETDLGTRIGEDLVVRARITWDDKSDGRVPLLVIDGRTVTWDELGRLLMSCEGWNVKIEIFERGDERW